LLKQGLFSKKLATIMLDAPVEFEEDKLTLDKPNIEPLKELFDELEFRTFAKRVFNDLSTEQTPAGEMEKISQGAPNLFSHLDTPVVIETKLSSKDVEKSYHLVDTTEKRRELYPDYKRKTLLFRHRNHRPRPEQLGTGRHLFLLQAKRGFLFYYLPIIMSALRS